jgi:hypothetical protein
MLANHSPSPAEAPSYDWLSEDCYAKLKGIFQASLQKVGPTHVICNRPDIEQDIPRVVQARNAPSMARSSSFLHLQF